MTFRPLLLVILLFSYSGLFAQTNPFNKSNPSNSAGEKRCYTDELAHKLYENDAQFRNEINSINTNPNNQKMGIMTFSDSIIRIPVVFHVIYNTTASNISLSQIESQIRILNEDFRRIPGTNGFGNGADTKIEFFLAQKDPQGDCTDGVVRIQSSLSNHNASNPAILKSISQWDPTRYLNFWVVNSMGGVLGYATFPSSLNSNPGQDGIVVADQYVGDEGTAGSGSFGFGRTATHEIGHWLGLFHTFQGGCGGNCASTGDLLCDTPPVDNPNFGCPIGHQSCGNTDLIENYMDYTDDLCMDMFTPDQSNRMISQINQYRSILIDSINALNAGYYGCSVAVTATLSGSDTICLGDDARLLFNLTGKAPFNVVYTDGNSNFTLNNISSPHVEIISSLNSNKSYSLISVQDQDSLKTAPDPSISGTVDIVINGIKPVSAQIFASATICNGDSTQISFSVNGGTAPYKIEIDNGVGILNGVVNNTNIQIAPSSSQTYTLLSIEDADNCSTPNLVSNASVVVNPSPSPYFLKTITKNWVTFSNQTSGATSFLWNFGDSTTSTLEDPVHKYKSTGVKNVSLSTSNSNGCTGAYSENITISEISSLDVLKEGESLSFYPNPVIDVLHITLKLNQAEEIFVEVIDLNGSKKITGLSSVKSTDHELEISMGDLAGGIYILNIRLENGRNLRSQLFHMVN